MFPTPMLIVISFLDVGDDDDDVGGDVEPDFGGGSGGNSGKEEMKGVG